MAHVGGLGASLLGLVFVAIRLAQSWNVSDFELGSGSVALLGLSIVYASANLLLASAWRRVLAHLGLAVSSRWSLSTYGVSQVARYVPGNIFQIASRQALAVAAGLPGWTVAKSAIWELALITTAGGSFVIVALPLFFGGLPGPGDDLLLFGVLTAIGLAAYWALSSHIALAWMLYAGFLSVSGMVFLVTLSVVAPDHGFPDPSASIAIAGSYVVAWLVGLLTPGAPAGVGVREVVLVTTLGQLVTPSDLLAAVVLGRVVTVGGDVIFYLVAASMRARSPSK